MCGRFASYKNLNKLKKIFNISNSDFNITQSYNISPTKCYYYIEL